MFDLANYNSRRMAMTSSSKFSLLSSDETASTSSVSSDSTPGSSSGRNNNYNYSSPAHEYKDVRMGRSASFNDSYNEYQDKQAVHYPPKIAFQIFELIELKRRCRGLYIRHQEKRRLSVIKANQEFMSSFESYEIDGELFV